MSDVIGVLRELRQSSASSVVKGVERGAPTARPTVSNALDRWLAELVLDEAYPSADAARTLDLVVLAGNAGDGKSHLIRSVRDGLIDAGLETRDVAWLLDATQSSRTSNSSVGALKEFLADFAAARSVPRLHVAAINTGAIVQFQAVLDPSDPLSKLATVMLRQLGIESASERLLEELQELDARVLVVDLDRRSLAFPVEVGGDPPFVDQILDFLEPGTGALVSQADNFCSGCPAAGRCPIRLNLSALQLPAVRERVSLLLRNIAVEDRVHLSPRLLWQLVHELTVGGLDRCKAPASEERWTCTAIVNLQADSYRPSFGPALFYNSLFDWGAEPASTASHAMRRELTRVDPAHGSGLDGFVDGLIAGLSPDRELDTLTAFVANLVAVEPEVLVSPAHDSEYRALSAIRRHYFFGNEQIEDSAWLDEFQQLLVEFRTAVLTQDRYASRVIHNWVIEAYTTMQAASAGNNEWTVPLPWKPATEVTTTLAVPAPLRTVERDFRVLGPGAVGDLAPSKRHRELAQVLAALPVDIPIRIQLGNSGSRSYVTLRVNWALYRLLRLVALGHRAASLDPESVQQLDRFAAELLVNKAGNEMRVGNAVLDFDSGELLVEAL